MLSFVPAAQHLISLSDNNNTRAAQWADYQWNAEWMDSPTRRRIYIPDTGTHPTEWHSQEETGSGLTASAPVSDISAPAYANGAWRPTAAACECGAKEQTVDHVVLQCPIYRPPPWTEWLDGSGRWYNRMFAQHLPRDLVRPSSG